MPKDKLCILNSQFDDTHTDVKRRLVKGARRVPVVQDLSGCIGGASVFCDILAVRCYTHVDEGLSRAATLVGPDTIDVAKNSK